MTRAVIASAVVQVLALALLWRIGTGLLALSRAIDRVTCVIEISGGGDDPDGGIEAPGSEHGNVVAMGQRSRGKAA